MPPRSRTTGSPRRARLLLLLAATGVLGCRCEWTVRGRDADCTVRRDMTVREVRAACGVPFRTAVRPKAWGSLARAVFQDGPLQCAAPADLYEDLAVAYDCCGRVDRVLGVQDEWMQLERWVEPRECPPLPWDR